MKSRRNYVESGSWWGGQLELGKVKSASAPRHQAWRGKSQDAIREVDQFYLAMAFNHDTIQQHIKWIHEIDLAV